MVDAEILRRHHLRQPDKGESLVLQSHDDERQRVEDVVGVVVEEDDVAALYDRDRQVAAIYTVFAFMAVVVACLGLFGLSLFDVRQRYREIGIRKVNGAGLKDICLLLIRKYVWLLGVAYVVSLPIAVWLIYRYTEGFIVKALLGVGMFLLALLIVAVISMGTLVGQVRKAARINPAEVVKSE